jgi:phospho-N-acetylmuramoyl-pentapeptide-transferase
MEGQLYLGLLIFSFMVNAGLMLPFIDFLYRMRFIRNREVGEVRPEASEEFKQMRLRHSTKAGTPTGGGVLLVLITALLFAVLFPLLQLPRVNLLSGFPLGQEVGIIFFTFVAFGMLGLYDDVLKIFGFEKTGFFGLRMRHKFAIQWILATIVSLWLHFGLQISFLNIPGFGLVQLGWWYIPIAAFLIVTFTNAFDITDGLDGLSCGLLMICLFAFWIIASAGLDRVLSLFICLWLGGLIAFLYFNIHPARIMLGNAGGLAFGATLAVVGLVSGKMIALMIIGGLFLVDGGSSLIQLLSKKLLKRRVFPIAPIHHYLEHIGWEEPKIVARAWLAGLMLAIFGVWLAVL